MYLYPSSVFKWSVYSFLSANHNKQIIEISWMVFIFVRTFQRKVFVFKYLGKASILLKAALQLK